MGDLFFTKLPAGHAILSMTRAAAFTSLNSEPALDVAVAAGVGEALRQYAAMSWLLSDVHSPASFQKLSAASRLYAPRLCGLDAGSRGAAAQATRIHAHLTSHHPALAGQGRGGGGGNAGGGGGAGNGQGGAGGADAGGGGGGGGGGPAAPPGDDTEGFAPALLSPPQLVALLALPCAEVRQLLDATGVHTVPASLTRTCAPRGRQQPGQPRSFVPRRRFSLFLTESKLGCSTALTYLRRGGRRRGVPRYSRFFGPAVTRHGPRIRSSAAALSTGSAQNSFVSPSDSRRPNRWQRPPLIRFVRG
jgi:hypothetical protein